MTPSSITGVGQSIHLTPMCWPSFGFFRIAKNHLVVSRHLLGQPATVKYVKKSILSDFINGVNLPIEMSTVYSSLKRFLMVTMSSAGLQVLLSNTCVIYGYLKDNKLDFMVNLDFYPHKCRLVQGTPVMF